jgi:predicted nucleic acid-binding protein
MSVSCFAEVMCTLGLRIQSREQLSKLAEELKDQFDIVSVGVPEVIQFAELHRTVRADGILRTMTHFWDAALSKLRGFKILAVNRNPFERLVDRFDFVEIG